MELVTITQYQVNMNWQVFQGHGFKGQDHRHLPTGRFSTANRLAVCLGRKDVVTFDIYDLIIYHVHFCAESCSGGEIYICGLQDIDVLFTVHKLLVRKQ